MIRRFPPQFTKPAARPCARSAVAAVEFAVLLPFLTCMLLGLTDLGRLFYYSMTLENALHNGMLFMSQAFDNQNQQWIGTTQYWQGPNGNLSACADAVELDAANLSPALPAGNISSATGTDSDGNSIITVTVSYNFTPLVPYPGLPSQVPITRSGQIRVAPATPK